MSNNLRDLIANHYARHKKSLDKKITFEKIKNSYKYILSNYKKLYNTYKSKAYLYSYIYIKRFRAKTIIKLCLTVLVALFFTYFLGTFNIKIFTYEGLLFFSQDNLPFLYANQLTDVSYDIVFLGFKYFLFYRIFNVFFFYLLIKEVELLPLHYQGEIILENVLKGYLSSILFPFIGPWLLLASEREEYYYYLYKYRITQFLKKVITHFVVPFISAVCFSFLFLLSFMATVFFLIELSFRFFLAAKYIFFVFIAFLIVIKWEEAINK